MFWKNRFKMRLSITMQYDSRPVTRTVEALVEWPKDYGVAILSPAFIQQVYSDLKQHMQFTFQDKE